MHDALRAYIEKYASEKISDADFEEVKKAFTFKRYKKGQFLLQEGEVSKYTAFVLKGSMRQYSVDAKGTEHIIHFGIENWWVGDRESSTMLTPSNYNIDAIEDTEVLLTTSEDLQQLTAALPVIGKMVNTMNQRNFIASQKRIHDALSLTAEERYLELLKNHPDFLQRFPQTMLASYLGITAETYSRIRKKALK
ncbi:Crp/Fnr family transcriptional regulator [Cytophaga hutchinsonii]|uniref:Cyclic nucleotide binding-regulatory protein n=1 Tax=Cytophaga hutchinsonii (strain ATCC 33406 / DSM 1761 / CIP 103989 / NBRC 15051 / NCIMB 9469 / D465) TaxID=269798 RepID=A0A6N4SNS0_CYTH3|nr:Crp/Fnr family transcriptional regulator [Cytophaga hutchinsonii]ABG57965.1 cyclic nucleotide binding-regulatory protein [Cytophaga hutchinsonii ATCC 33406]SFX10208.1 cAMP-binding domain of CRP or a regulatory subunit of cAMP-dependent protein kinases [Cytophaga hutchinsonii ATCC 33406]